jgi:ribonuclease P protein component
MIARTHRFHGRGSLQFVYQKGRTVRGAYGSLKFVRNNRRNAYRMAVVVSKKVHKSAVVRNRIRRRVYEVVRTSVVADQPYDVVFTAFSEKLADISAEELQKAVTAMLRSAEIPLKTRQQPVGESASRDIVDNKEK